MTNQDNKFGTHCKRTHVLSQICKEHIIFEDTQSAIDFFYTKDAQAVINECCTELEWQLQTDHNGNKTKLKFTMAFGTKGIPGIAPEDDWAGLFNSRKDKLLGENNWGRGYKSQLLLTDHLF
jgi:hypothetical protein